MTGLRWVALLGCAGAVSLVGSGSSARGAAPVSPSRGRRTQTPPTDEVTAYRRWRRITPKPVYLLPALYADCAAPAPESPPADTPHTGGYIDVFVKMPGGRFGAASTGKPYPAGSVIVKEKRQNASDRQPVLLTVMRKREAGFAPGHGDWEYQVYQAHPLRRVASETGRCQACHEKTRSSDFVFATYLPRSASERRPGTANPSSRAH